MTLQLKTSHALYSYIEACIGVQDDNTIVDFKGAQTLTPHANVLAAIGTGTFGRHFRTFVVSSNAQGVALSPGILTKKSTGGGVGTTFVVVNAGNSRTSRGGVYDVNAVVGPAVYTGDAVGLANAANYPAGLGTTDVIATGAHSFAAGVNGTSGGKVWVNGAPEGTALTTNQGAASDVNKTMYIGGSATGGYGGLAADYVWVVQFNKFLSDAEVADLHASLGSGAFGLVEDASATAPGAPTIGTATAAVTGASVAFTGPASDGGSTITSYLATASTGETASNSVSPIVFGTGTLTAGVGRTFHVQAINGVGTGTASAESNSVTPSAANAPPTFSGTIANITGTGGTAITPVDVSALFTDSGDTKAYSASPGGTAWPAGLVVHASTGIISGTVATSTTTGLKVRCTDTASQTVDSNAFSATLAAPASTVTSVTVSPSTATVTGGSTQVFTASVAGASSPSQTVNWSATAGSINAGGTLTAPTATGSAQTVTVTATSAQDGTKFGTSTVTVPALASATFTIPEKLELLFDGSSRAGLAVHAVIMDMARNRLGVKTGLTLDSASKCPIFTYPGITAGTPHRVDIVNDADLEDFAATTVIPA